MLIAHGSWWLCLNHPSIGILDEINAHRRSSPMPSSSNWLSKIFDGFLRSPRPSRTLRIHSSAVWWSTNPCSHCKVSCKPALGAARLVDSLLPRAGILPRLASRSRSCSRAREERLDICRVVWSTKHPWIQKTRTFGPLFKKNGGPHQGVPNVEWERLPRLARHLSGPWKMHASAVQWGRNWGTILRKRFLQLLFVCFVEVWVNGWR